VERVPWPYLIDDRRDGTLQEHVDNMGSVEAGRLIHNWIQNEFSDLPLEYEVYCENGKYDCSDGEEFVYEFKTKHPNVFDYRPPYNDDISQVEKYLESEDVEADKGVLVYINRGDLSEVKQYLVNGSVYRIED